MNNLASLSKYLRYLALKMTTTAGSGHPTSSLSAADLMGYLISEVFRYDIGNPNNPNNDRMIFSKGHATPLYYGLFVAMGFVSEKDLERYRKIDSILEGHPTFRFPFAEAATGSLGQGLSVGVGLVLAIKAKIKDQKSTIKNMKENFKPPTTNYQPITYVLLGDGELAEGSVWEAAEMASYYQLDNLVAIVDANQLGQSRETMQGHNVEVYEQRFKAFGWDTIVIDGHDFGEIKRAFDKAKDAGYKPFVIIARTFKGSGISFLEDKDNWHGKPLPADLFEKAVIELGEIKQVKVEVRKPESVNSKQKTRNNKQLTTHNSQLITYKEGDSIATRKAYGETIASLGEVDKDIVVLDAEVSNSTYSEIFRNKFPERYFEMFIAEQNMVGTAVGFSRLGFKPFVSTFAAFLTRAYDQIRMAALSGAEIRFCGSHAGVSIGEDGPSQMGLEDISMFRSIQGSTVLYPSDAVSTAKLVAQMVDLKGISYLRASRPNTSVIYKADEEFPIGGCKVHMNKSEIRNPKSEIIIITAGVTLFEVLKAQEELAKEGIEVTVVDLYSVKPIDSKTLLSLVQPPTTNHQPITNIITVEDHWFDGGLGDAVLNVFSNHRLSTINHQLNIHKLAVNLMPRSGKPAELLNLEGIDSAGIIKKAKEILQLIP